MKFNNLVYQAIIKYWKSLRSTASSIEKMQVYQEARSRILLWYLGLMFLFVAIAIPTIRYRLIAQVTERVEADMREELEEFEGELIESLLESKNKPDPKLSASENLNVDIYRAFDEFIATNEAEDDNYFI